MKKWLFIYICCLWSTLLTAQCTDNGNRWKNSWVSCTTSPNPNVMRSNDGHWILFEFDTNQNIDSTHIWNANRANESAWGLNKVVIDYSIDGTLWQELGHFSFPKASETTHYTGFEGPNFGGIPVKKILITVLSTHEETTNCASLAEIQFKTAPHIPLETGIVVKLHAILEGAYQSSNNAMSGQLANLASTIQPFNTAPWNYTGEEFVEVFPDNFIDWVLIELRDATNPMVVIQQKAALLLDNGAIVDVAGSYEGVLFPNLAITQPYYIAIRSRNHLAVLSAQAQTLPNINSQDFAKSTEVLGGPTQLANIGNNTFALIPGDWNNDGVISVADFNGLQNDLSTSNSYLKGDFNFDGEVTVDDFNLYQSYSSWIGVLPIRY